MVEVLAENRVPNPALAYNRDGWVAGSGVVEWLADEKAAEFTADVTANSGIGHYLQDSLPSAEGDVWTGLARLSVPADGVPLTVRPAVIHYGNGSRVDGPDLIDIAPGETVDVRVVSDPGPEGATGVRLGFYLRSAFEIGDRLWLHRGAMVPGVYDGDYFDGDTPSGVDYEYRWTGTRHASASVKVPRVRVASYASLVEDAGRGWRVHAQRITTGDWLTRDLPLTQPTTSRELTGPGGVFGVLTPEMLRAQARDGRPLVEEFTTALYVEDGGQLRGGGIVQNVAHDKAIKTVEAPGFSAYPAGIPYMDNYRPDGFPDPIDVFRHLWEYVQSFPDGDIGVQVAGDAETWLLLSSGSGPFIMSTHEYRDCGDTMNSLAQAVPFDYIERHTWGPDHETVNHTIEVGFPRIGRRRHDLRFADGENVTDFGTISPDGERYSNDVYMMGRGEGSGMLRARATVRDGRLRRPKVVSKKAATQGLLNRLAKQELNARRLLPDIPSITIKDHVNARIAAINPGDDILVELEVEWLGTVRLWLRVLSIEETGDAPGMAVLRTKRADSFEYLTAKSPTGEKQVVTL